MTTPTPQPAAQPAAPRDSVKPDIAGGDPNVPFNELAPMEFVLDRKEVPVKLKHPKTGVATDYVLRELDGNERDGYLNNVGSRMRHDKAGSPAGLRDYKGLQANLVGRCLYTVAGTRVGEAEIQAFPSTVLGALFERAQLISGLDEDAEKKPKNDEGEEND